MYVEAINKYDPDNNNGSGSYIFGIRATADQITELATLMLAVARARNADGKILITGKWRKKGNEITVLRYVKSSGEPSVKESKVRPVKKPKISKQPDKPLVNGRQRLPLFSDSTVGRKRL